MKKTINKIAVIGTYFDNTESLFEYIQKLPWWIARRKRVIETPEGYFVFGKEQLKK